MLKKLLGLPGSLMAWLSVPSNISMYGIKAQTSIEMTFYSENVEKRYSYHLKAGDFDTLLSIP